MTHNEDEREPYNIMSCYVIRDPRLLTIRPQCTLVGIDWEQYLNQGAILSAPMFSFFLLTVYRLGGDSTYIPFVGEDC